MKNNKNENPINQSNIWWHNCCSTFRLGYLSSGLKKNGHKVKILDGLREKIEYDPSEWDIVGVTAMSTYFPECVQEVARAKAYGLKTIIGGQHVICDPIQSLID